MKITRTITTNIYTAHFDNGLTAEIAGRYSYAAAKAELQKNYPGAKINAIEITQASKKYEMPLDDFIKYAAEVEQLKNFKKGQYSCIIL